jgi:tetratricopeptide (TPR) repeat protein
MCCVNLGRFTVAMMALEQAEKHLGSPEAPVRMGADLAAIRGYIDTVTGSPTEAVRSYSRAIELYTRINNPFETCRCTVNLGYALLESGSLPGARQQLTKALEVAEASGYDRHAALALGNLSLLCLREGNMTAAESYALRSNVIARAQEYVSVLFRNCYYLWKIARERKDEAGIKANERTLRTYVTRVEEHVPEVREFRAYLAGERA